ncbi:hypothetical protein C8J56DRAFT_905481 [Mycena floridula]|nr:hypothetical protein C8J56DRAFT_905481 [Mycena floridula]
MLFMGRLPVGDRFNEPTSPLDIAFLYGCALIGAKPGQYVNLLTTDQVNVQMAIPVRKRFPLLDYVNYTPMNIAKFFTNQGKMPIYFDDAFTWIRSFSGAMASYLHDNPHQVSLFKVLHQETLKYEPPVRLGIGPEGSHYLCLPRPPKAKDAVIPLANLNATPISPLGNKAPINATRNANIPLVFTVAPDNSSGFNPNQPSLAYNLFAPLTSAPTTKVEALMNMISEMDLIKYGDDVPGPDTQEVGSGYREPTPEVDFS